MSKTRQKLPKTPANRYPEINKVYHGNCLDILRSWPDNFIDCVVTSPPYYGLRSYGTPPQIWDGHSECRHKWTKALKHPKMDNRTPEQKANQGATVGNNTKTAKFTPVDQGQHCEKCHAWKGELGLEPSFRDYIRHLIQIFTEVYRVLKPTGTCFVNLGDSYNNNSSKTDVGRAGFANDKSGNFNRLDSTIPYKSLMNIPHRFAIAMTDEIGFAERNGLIWWKRSAMPFSGDDRWTVETEDIFFFVKKGVGYYFEQQLEPAEGKAGKRKTDLSTAEHNVAVPYARAGNPHGNKRNARSILDVNTEKTDVEHYASYPTRLVEIPITAGCPYAICNKCDLPKRTVYEKTVSHESGSGRSGNLIEGKKQDANDMIRENNDIRLGPVVDYRPAAEIVCKCGDEFHPGLVLDPFSGTGTTQAVAIRLRRNFIGIELQDEYHKITSERLEKELEKKDRSLF